MKPLLLALLLSGCSATPLICPQGDVELRSRAPVIDTMPDAGADRPSQQIECVAR